ncbi:MAG: hypothetical protein R3B84_13570 [Zavarzinella sp.]
MKTFSTGMVAALVLFVATGCSNNKGKLEGTKWVNNAAVVKGNNIPAGVMTLEFRTDGTMVYDIVGTKYTGKYSLGMGDNVTWNLDQKLGNSNKHVEKCSISGDTLTVKDSDGTAMTFKRAK